MTSRRSSSLEGWVASFFRPTTTTTILLLGLITFIHTTTPTVQAAYPGTLLPWTNCDANTLCGVLEFCQDGRSYGYRAQGDTAPCGSVNGPLIRMEQGKSYKLTLQNEASTVTNIHTHGLHIVGDGDSDDVTRMVSGSSSSPNCLDYTWDIGIDHPPGTYWYHPHFHGLTNDQTGGGAYGMIVIEDDRNTLTNSGATWALPENELLLQISDAAGGLLGNGKDGTEMLPMTGNVWYRLRVSAVDPSAKPSEIEFIHDANSCFVYKVASDGVWHSAPVDTYPGTLFELTGASRADFAIKCDGSSNSITPTIEWGGQLVATLDVTGYAGGTHPTPPGTAPPRPGSIDEVMIANAIVPTTNTRDISISAAKINGQDWDPDVGLGSIAWNEIHEWTVSGSGAHPFHLHLYHMLIVTPGGCGPLHEEGEFYDTLSSGTCTVRFFAADFGQRMVMHCHVLRHEDNGAMSWMEVGDGDATMPRNDVVSLEYQCSSSPPPPPPAPITPVPTPGPTAVSTPAPSSSSPPTTIASPTPTAAPVNGPPPCLGSGIPCSQNSDCCSDKCKRNECRGNRRLQEEKEEEEGLPPFLRRHVG